MKNKREMFGGSVKKAKLLLFLCFVCISSALFGNDLAYAQQTHFTFSMNSVKIQSVFDRIEKESEFVFFYSDKVLNPKEVVSVTANNETVSQILDKLLAGYGVAYTINNRQITLTKNCEQPAEIQSLKHVDQDDKEVHGVVQDISGEPLPGAAIQVKGTSRGVSSDMNGKFSIRCKSTDFLVISFLGMKEREIKVGNQTNFLVKLEEEGDVLDEVVVVAYGAKTKATITGATSSLNNKDLIKAPPVASVTNILAGAMPGVAAVQSTGQPGQDAAELYIRGCGSLNNSLARPLVLVDGVERDFSQLDPNEIESISILKDASSTAVFGVRGANGVVLVTTRRGTNGKPVINISSTMGVQQPISLVHQATSEQFARFWNIKMEADGVTDPKRYWTDEQIELFRTGADPMLYPSIDWSEYCFNDFFLQSKNNVNISGGTERLKYFVSLGYLWQNGLMKQFDSLPYDNNYKYNRYNYRANLDVALTSTTNMKLNIGGVAGQIQEPNVIENIAHAWTCAQVWSLPFAGPGLINGRRTIAPIEQTPMTEMMRDGLFTFYGYGYHQYYDTSLNMDVDITQKLDFLTKGLSVSFKASYDNNFTLNKNHQGSGTETQMVYYKSFLDSGGQKPITDPDFDRTHVFIPSGKDSPLTYSEGAGRDRNWYMEARINYEHSFGDHNVGGLLLYNQSRNYYPNSGGYVYIPRGYVGLVGRATYNYRTKYLIDFSIGYNGSENFAPGKTRFGLFPSISVGWVMSAEKFMQNQSVVDYLKWRLSYGKVGSDATSSRFMYMPSVWSQSGSYSFGVNNPIDRPAFGTGTPGNPDVTWETAYKQNYGVEVKFLDNRLSLTADYFFEHRTNILLSPQTTPGIIATSLPNLNLGIVDNQGYEISLGWKEKIGSDFDYYIDANVSFAKNKIIFQDEVPNTYGYQNFTGGSTGRYSGMYKFLRLYQEDDFVINEEGNKVLDSTFPQPYFNVQPGDAMYADLNGDNLVNADDKMVTGYSNRPEYVLGLNTGFTWKGFNFSMQWTGATHVNKMLEIEFRIPFTNSGGRGLIDYFYEQCWTPQNQLEAKLPRASETSEAWNSENSTLWLKDSSYLRLKNLNIGYTFNNKPLLKKIGINSLGISLTGYNLLTFTPLDFIDPEGNTTNSGDYPLVKLYSLGLNINF